MDKNYISSINGLKLIWGIKSPDLDLYDFGFTRYNRFPMKLFNKYTFVIHAQCVVILIWEHPRHVEVYDGESIATVFNSRISNMIGLCVKNTKLRKNNDLLIDFGECKMIIETMDDDEESWRFFKLRKKDLHMVVSKNWISFE